MSESALEKRIDEIRKITKEYAKAKSMLTKLEHSRHIILADLMKESYRASNDKVSVAKCDMEARSNPIYKKHIEQLAIAEEHCIQLNWELKLIQMRFDQHKASQYAINQEQKNYGFKS